MVLNITIHTTVLLKATSYRCFSLSILVPNATIQKTKFGGYGICVKLKLATFLIEFSEDSNQRCRIQIDKTSYTKSQGVSRCKIYWPLIEFTQRFSNKYLRSTLSLHVIYFYRPIQMFSHLSGVE